MAKYVKWKDELAIRIYQLACDGLSAAKIAEQLGISTSRLNTWKQTKPIVKFAFAEAKKRGGRYGGTLQEYIYNQLSPKLKRTWDRINEVMDTPNGLLRVTRLMAKRGRKTQQHLFLYALTNSHFNASQACSKIGIPFQRVKKWLEEDPEFATLTDEVHLHKKNFFESKLVELVGEKDTQAVLFANKTLNKDRGYAEKQEHVVEVKGNISQTQMITFDERLFAFISKSAQRELLGAIDKMEKEQEKIENQTVPALSHRILEKV